MSNLITHAKREFESAWRNEPAEEMQLHMEANLLQLLQTFSDQGHSGFSANYCLQAFAKLATFEPLGPLTGADTEWMEVSEGVFQNLRCSHVFKQTDRFDGQAYDINGRVFTSETNGSWTNSDSMVPITFPYTPVTEYVKVEDESA